MGRMTKRQSAILAMLVAAAGLHIWLDPAAKSNFKSFMAITPENWKQLSANEISVWLLWFIGLAGLMLLSDWQPKIATMIAFLILVGAVLINSDPIATWITNTIQNMGLTSSQADSSPSEPPAVPPSTTGNNPR